MSLSIGLLSTRRRSLSTCLALTHIGLVSLGFAAVLGGCGGTRELRVRVSIPGPDSLEVPASGVGVIALPYDRDSVLATLEAHASRPRPHTAELESLFAAFRGPFTSYTKTVYTTTRLQDTLAHLQRQLDSTRRDSPDYPILKSRLASVSASLHSTQEESQRARVILDRARANFVSRSESLRSDVRQWEDSTYGGYDSIVENLTKARGLEAKTDTTDATGWARLSLPRGRWWIYAHAWNTNDPNAEWYWNIPVTADTVLLSSRTARRRPRY